MRRYPCWVFLMLYFLQRMFSDIFRRQERKGKGIYMTGNGNDKNSDNGIAPRECGCHTKHTPRSEKQKKQLQNRISRMAGQLNGISRMLEENRYCGDILIQVSAVESALQSFGYLVLKEHLETCVVEEVQKGNGQIMEETIELVKKLK